MSICPSGLSVCPAMHLMFSASGNGWHLCVILFSDLWGKNWTRRIPPKNPFWVVFYSKVSIFLHFVISFERNLTTFERTTGMYHLWPSTSTVQVCCDVMRMTAVVTYTGKKGYLPVSADLIWSVSAWQWFHSSKTSNQKGIQVTPWSYFSLLGLGSPHRAAYTASFQYKKYENRRVTSIVSRGGGTNASIVPVFLSLFW